MHRLPPLAGAWTVAMLRSCNAALVALVALAVLTVLFLGVFCPGILAVWQSREGNGRGAAVVLRV